MQLTTIKKLYQHFPTKLPGTGQENRNNRSLIASESGVTAIEFAFVFPMIMLCICFIMELGMIFFAAISIENAISSATRLAKIGITEGGMSRDDYIRKQIREKSFGLINAQNLLITNEISKLDPKGGYAGAAGERCSNGASCPCPAGVTFNDTNNNGVCDIGGSLPLDTGGPGDIVAYTVIYKWHIFTPVLKYIGDSSGDYTIISGGAVRNEPFPKGP